MCNTRRSRPFCVMHARGLWRLFECAAYRGRHLLVHGPASRRLVICVMGLSMHLH